MKIRKCSRCQEVKSETHFFKDKSKVDGLSSQCKPCMNSVSIILRKTPIYRKKKRDYYKKNRVLRKKWLIEKMGGKCLMCNGIFDEICFDFHHVSNKNKAFHVGKMFLHSKDVLIKEAKKCILLCANCHRILHKQVGGGGGRPCI